MNYEEMKKSHEVQIKALLKGDYKTFKAQFSGPNYDKNFTKFRNNHHSAWGYTGGQPHSLFANLPEADRCLTQIKNHPEDDPYWTKALDLENNDLIPTQMLDHTVLNEAQLREFSKLQLEANFSEEIT